MNVGNQKSLSQESRYPGRDVLSLPRQYKLQALTLVWLLCLMSALLSCLSASWNGKCTKYSYNSAVCFTKTYCRCNAIVIFVKIKENSGANAVEYFAKKNKHTDAMLQHVSLKKQKIYRSNNEARSTKQNKNTGAMLQYISLKKTKIQVQCCSMLCQNKNTGAML